MRSCACRGESGFAHLACLGGYAWRKSEEFFYNSSGVDKSEARDPWSKCPTCHQAYTGHLKFDLAKYYIEKTRSLPENDCRKLFALLNLAETKAGEFGDFTGGREQFEEVLAVIHSSGSNTEDLSELAPLIEVECVEGLAMGYDILGDKNTSLFYYEKAHELGLLVYSPSHPLLNIIESHLKRVKSNNTSPSVAYFRARLKECREHFGEDDYTTIMAKVCLSESLVREEQVAEACDLCKNAYDTAKQSLGPAHETTKMAEKNSKRYRTILDSYKVQAAIIAGNAKPAKLMSADPSLDGKMVFILRPARNDPKKYICAMVDDSSQFKKVKILLSKLIL
mmetsp:Transcript_8768/g.26232  ORF Transcript_8768/g.26232 Transcript_8768/m.26232 type:complete len:337 (+) Transcript_8768:262-1272(+)